MVRFSQTTAMPNPDPMQALLTPYLHFLRIISFRKKYINQYFIE
jgi:hypothetical protein